MATTLDGPPDALTIDPLTRTLLALAAAKQAQPQQAPAAAPVVAAAPARDPALNAIPKRPVAAPAPAAPAAEQAESSDGADFDPDALFDSVLTQESRHRPGITGEKTPYGIPEGEGQMLPATAEAMAKKLGVAWQPELMTGKTSEAEAYQKKLSRAYFDEGVDKYGRDAHKVLSHYYAGPNEKLWGPKTQAYAQEVAKRAGVSGASGGVGDDKDLLAQRKKTLGQLPGMEKEAAEADKHLAAYAEANQKHIEELEQKIRDEPMPTAPMLPEQPKPPKDVETKPFNVLRQFMPVIAALAGLKTRAPATAVLNAMGAAMEARQKNDKEEFDRQQTIFKDKMEEVHDQWAADREKAMMAFDIRKTKQEDRLNELKMLSLGMQDQKLQDDIAHGRLDDAWNHLKTVDAAVYQMDSVRVNMKKAEYAQQINAAKAEQAQATDKAIADLKGSPEFQKSTPLQQAVGIANITRSMSANAPFKQAQAAAEVRKELSNSPIGKAVGNATTYMPQIERAGRIAETSHFWDNNPLGSQEQAAFLDAFTKLMTGGQAIRGFTLKLNTDHASLWDKMDVLKQQGDRGGPLSKRQIAEMVQLAKEYSENLVKIADDAQTRANTAMQPLGLTPDQVTPFGAGALESEVGAPPAEEPSAPAAAPKDRFKGFSAAPVGG